MRTVIFIELLIVLITSPFQIRISFSHGSKGLSKLNKFSKPTSSSCFQIQARKETDSLIESKDTTSVSTVAVVLEQILNFILIAVPNLLRENEEFRSTKFSRLDDPQIIRY